MTPTEMLNEKDKARFLSKVKQTEDCWLWEGRLQPNGYGQLSIRRGTVLSHRAAYLAFIGLIPDKMLVCHTCDNRQCVNPEHLFLGTHKDNSQDMVAKGRSAKGAKSGPHKHPERLKRGEENGASKLTAEKVLKMKELYATGEFSFKRLGEMFSVRASSAHEAVTGRTWAHIHDDWV
jgi:hypothetical protein